MMQLVNLLVKDIIPFAAERNLDLCFVIKLIDYRLSKIEINVKNNSEVETYINNVRILNSVFLLLGLATDFSDKERKAYQNELLIPMLDDPERLIKYKKFKLEVIKTKFADDIKLFDEYIEEV